MTSLFFFSGLLLVFFAVAFLLGRRDAGPSRTGSDPAGHAPSLPAEAEEYLAQLDSALGLPAGVRADIRVELGDHLQDSIAAIEAEGLDLDRATREALARLGRPAELARQMRHAHQTTRRLLAGAAGGVFQAGLGIVFGYISSLLIFFVVVLLAGTLLKPPLDFLAERLPEWPFSVRAMVTASVGVALMSWLPAFFAGRWSVRALRRGSRRSSTQIARWWALGGTLVIAWYVVFGLSLEQSWLVVALVLLIPVAFAVGALWRTHRTLFLPGWRVPVGPTIALAVALAVLLVAGLASASTSTSDESWSTSYEQERIALDKVAPAWLGDPGFSAWGANYSGWSTTNSPIIEAGWDTDRPAALASLRDLRVEVWRAVPFEGAPDWVEDYVPAPGYSAPYLTQPAVLGGPGLSAAGSGIRATFDMGRCRTTRWLVFLTGVGSDGIRYRLEMPSPVTTSFSGTVWDWLRASE